MWWIFVTPIVWWCRAWRRCGRITVLPFGIKVVPGRQGAACWRRSRMRVVSAERPHPGWAKVFDRMRYQLTCCGAEVPLRNQVDVWRGSGFSLRNYCPRPVNNRTLLMNDVNLVRCTTLW